MSTGELWRAASHFVTYVQMLCSGGAASFPAAVALRERLLELLATLQTCKGSLDVTSEDIEEARFALVAWADEVILKSRWPAREEWLREPLQMQLYRTTRAGDEFYGHLERLGKQQVAAREVYFLVLALGFEGQLSGQDANRRALLAQQYEQLRATGRLLETPREQLLTPAAYELEIELLERNRSRMGVGLAALGFGLALIYALLWSVLAWMSPQLPLVPGLGA